MDQHFLNEELKERQFWEKRREEMRQHYLAEELREREFWEKKRDAMKQHYQNEELKERTLWEQKQEEMKHTFLAGDVEELQASEPMVDQMRPRRLDEEEHHIQILRDTNPETSHTSLAELGQTRQDKGIQLQSRGHRDPQQAISSPYFPTFLHSHSHFHRPTVDRLVPTDQLSYVRYKTSNNQGKTKPETSESSLAEGGHTRQDEGKTKPETSESSLAKGGHARQDESQLESADSSIHDPESDSLSRDTTSISSSDQNEDLSDEWYHRHGNEEDNDSRDNKVYEKSLICVTHEIQEVKRADSDKLFNYYGCEKGQGHTKLEPITSFKSSHLPNGYRDKEIVELIKATADLTVRVDVKRTSKERPEFWPNTKEKYAFYDSGSDVTRLGTGMIRFVYKNAEKYNKKYKKGTCKCKKCQHSDTPSKVWGKLRLFTSTQLIFDELEARHTTCRLFYDKNNSPVVTLDGWRAKCTDIEEDISELKCVTCNVNLLDKLRKVWDRWQDLRFKMNNKYKANRKADKLNFIVSHPHGWPKRVSVGHWIDRYEVGKHLTKYTYTTSTCPGSTGAHVYSLGYDDHLYKGLHVHSGVNSKGINTSSTGIETDL